MLRIQVIIEIDIDAQIVRNCKTLVNKTMTAPNYELSDSYEMQHGTKKVEMKVCE